MTATTTPEFANDQRSGHSLQSVVQPSRGKNWRLKITNAKNRITDAYARRHTALNKQRQREYIRWQIQVVRNCEARLNDKSRGGAEPSSPTIG